MTTHHSATHGQGNRSTHRSATWDRDNKPINYKDGPGADKSSYRKRHMTDPENPETLSNDERKKACKDIETTAIENRNSTDSPNCSVSHQSETACHSPVNDTGKTGSLTQQETESTDNNPREDSFLEIPPVKHIPPEQLIETELIPVRD